jgi:hypothetical protein
MEEEERRAIDSEQMKLSELVKNLIVLDGKI